MPTPPTLLFRLFVLAWFTGGCGLVAATIDWEAESAVDTNMTITGPYSPSTPEAKALLSGGEWFTGDNDGTVAQGRWQILVATAGEYQFFARRFWNHGAFRWHFDDQPWQTVESPLELLDSYELQPYVPVNWEKLGQVTLTAGAHQFSLELLPTSHMEFNKAYGFDCFKLTDAEFLGQRLTTK
jgi:hypothetical protein